MLPIRGSPRPRRLPQRSANFKIYGNTFLGRPTKLLGSQVANIWILIRKMKLPKASLHIFVRLPSGFAFRFPTLMNYQLLFYNMLGARLSHLILPDFVTVTILKAGPNGPAVQGVGLQPLACWDCGFESHRWHGCLSVVSVLCFQVEVSATSWSLVQRSSSDCGASLFVI